MAQHRLKRTAPPNLLFAGNSTVPGGHGLGSRDDSGKESISQDSCPIAKWQRGFQKTLAVSLVNRLHH